MSLINPSSLRDVDKLAGQYANAGPFPHLVIDDFLPLETAQLIHDEARHTMLNVDASNDVTQKYKRACTEWTQFGDQTANLIAYFNSALFISQLERITALDGVFGDPWIEGGGIHVTSRGGFLKMHTDFNWHAKLRADRRINILYYLNRDWRPDYGGSLRIQRLGQSEEKVIDPVFNRLVIFNTNDTTLHGHPEPLDFPDDYPRVSIAMYYYTSGLNVAERFRSKATTTRYLPRHTGDIALTSGSLRSRLGYLFRRFSRF